MITQLDTVSWAKELTTANSTFVEVSLSNSGFGFGFGSNFGSSLGYPSQTIFVVSNVRNQGSGYGSAFGSSFGSSYAFVVLQSDAVPPSPGPGNSFGAAAPNSIPVATYIFPQPNTSFDPVVAYDASAGLLHILGTRNTPTSGNGSNPQLNDLIKFTYNVNTQQLTGPVVVVSSMGSRIRGAFDMAVLPTGNTIVAACLTEPTLARTNISTIQIAGGVVSLTFPSMSIPFVSGQWILLNGFSTATFLNGQLLQVVEATATNLTAYFAAANYAVASDTGTVSPVGSSLLAVELNKSTNLPVPTTATILDSSPPRTGNTFDGVSLVVSGNSVELYYQSHPKNFTFADQVFAINFIGRDYPPDGGFGFNFGYSFGVPLSGFGSDFGYDFGLSGVWNASPTTLTTFTARYTDNRLTVLADGSGNRFMNLTYWSQFNHPEGIVGSVLIGGKIGSGSWFFHPTFGTTVGGSLVQSTLSIAQNGSVNLAYLLQPFNSITNPPSATLPAWPLKIASVSTSTLGLTDVPGFYNTANFTWLRGTKSLLDNESLWAIVGERETATTVSGEMHSIPALLIPPPPFTIQVNNAGTYFENIGVVYLNTLVSLVEVVTDPEEGEYTVDETTGVYTFSEADASASVLISYQYISSLLPVYASLFNVPPIANVTPTSATVWRGGSFYATDVTTINSFSISSNVVTLQCTNDFTSGQQIAVYGFNNPLNQFLNGTILTVMTATSSYFTATFTHADFTSVFVHADFSSVPDVGYAAALIPGTLILSAAGSTDADSDALTYVWSDNDPSQSVSLVASGALASVNVAKSVGPEEQIFDVGVAIVDLFPDLVTQRHPSLMINTVAVSGRVLTVTFTAPTGALVPIAGEQIMFYNLVLGAPAAPGSTTAVGGFLPVQGAPGFGYQFGAGFGIYNPISVIITYLNSAGETVGSTNSVVPSINAGSLLVVTSPSLAGDAEYYNVYVGKVGSETLQPNSNGQFLPTLLGTNWTEPTTGFTSITTVPPQISTALQEFLNDQVVVVTTSSPNTLTAAFSLGFGYSFGFDFGVSAFPATNVTGSGISQYQFEQIEIVVPQNVEPTVTFPAPSWVSNVLQTTVARNANITITPETIVNPSVQFPIVYTGLTDPDDVPTYLWQQISGTSVFFPDGVTQSSLVISTAGVNINGESLVFSLTVNDSVNPALTTEFTVPVAAYNFTSQDTKQLARSVYSANAIATNVQILNGVGTISAINNFLAGQTIWFEGMINAKFLNGSVFTVLATGYGSGFSAGFGGSSLSGIKFQIANNSLPNYGPISDTGVVYSSLPISQRNTPPVSPNLPWSPLDISIMYSDLQSIKRTSVLDGSDRYIAISPHSVLVYGVFPEENPEAVLLRKLLLPNNGQILDAVHTEQDYTLVFDSEGNIWRYSAAPFINTDNPDTVINTADFTLLSFGDLDDADDVKIATTVSFGNQRVVVLSGEEGALLIQMNTTTLEVTGTLELDVASNFVYGASKIQFVRWVDMDNLHSGRILLGTILNQSAQISSVQLGAITFNSVFYSANTLLVTCNNSFSVGDEIVLSGLQANPSTEILNGLTVEVIATTPTGFIASLAFPAQQAPGWNATSTYVTGQIVNFSGTAYVATSNVPASIPPPNLTYWNAISSIPLTSDSGLAQSQNSGSTFETLIDLSRNQIIGTFDKSKLRNQFVETGEILFNPDDTYAGSPTAPVLLPPTTVVLGSLTQVNLQWQQVRTDLITSYTVQYAIENPVAATVPSVPPYTFQVSNSEFTGDEGVLDVTANGYLQPTKQTSPLTGQYFVDESTGTYTFNQSAAGHSLIITARQAFQNLIIVNSGNVESVFVSLPLGRIYFFQVQASGLDGTSNFSNIQSITI